MSVLGWVMASRSNNLMSEWLHYDDGQRFS